MLTNDEVAARVDAALQEQLVDGATGSVTVKDGRLKVDVTSANGSGSFQRLIRPVDRTDQGAVNLTDLWVLTVLEVAFGPDVLRP